MSRDQVALLERSRREHRVEAGVTNRLAGLCQELSTLGEELARCARSHPGSPALDAAVLAWETRTR